MAGPDASWSTQQLTEFLATVSSFTNREAAQRGAVERIAEALEAEVAVLVTEGTIAASVGFPAADIPADAVLAVIRGDTSSLEVPGAGTLPTVVVATGADPIRHIVVARSGEDPFTHGELDLLRGMGRVLSLTLELLEALAASRQAAVVAERARANVVKAAILEAALDCVITADDLGRIVDFNPAAERTFGYRRQDVVGKTLAETIIPARLRGAHLKGLADYVRTGHGRVLDRRIEMVGMRSDGSEFPVELAITPIKESGQLLFAAYLRDITERKRSEEETAASMSLLQATLESTADGILVVNREGHMVDLNQRFVDMWRIPPEIIASRDDDRALAFILEQLEDPKGFLARVLDLYDSDEEAFDEVVFKDGRVFERYSKPQRVGDQTVGRVWSFRDLTDHRRLESELRWAQKMEAVGRLAGGVAHDFNNLLAVILNYATFLEEDLADDHERRGDVVGIREAAERGAALVRQLLVFSRKEIVKPQILDVNRVIDEMQGLLATTIGENMKLVLALSDEPWPVKADQGQIEQILMNLVVNARDAMPGGGEVSVQTSNVAIRDEHLRRASMMRLGSYVRIDVRDSGTGMTDDVKARIFDPFFTTKGRGEGTGLGLATVYGIVKRLNGYVFVESASGRGAAFEVYLPVTDERAEMAPTARSPRPAPATGEKIVVVEDEAGVRETVTRILSRGGYSVLPAATGHEAIELFEAHGDSIDLLLTDVVMPGMSGRVLSEQLSAAGHRFRTLYMSGYPDDIVARQGFLSEGEELIQKPFAADDLLLRVGEVLQDIPTA